MSQYLTLMLLAMMRFTCSEGVQFTDSSLEDGKSFMACTGARLQFRWDVNWARKERFGHAEFFFTGPASPKRLVFASDRLVPIPPHLSPHIMGDKLEEYHLTLSGLKPEHSGVYSLEITPSLLGVAIERSVNVYVLGIRSLENLKLEVKYEVVVEENTTDQWSLQLRCGGFPFNTPVPLNVEWVLPSGETIQATSFENSSYILPLSAPVMRGKYVCRIPKELNNLTCAGNNSILNKEASLEVNLHSMELIQQIVETRQKALQKEMDQLKRRIFNCEAKRAQRGRSSAKAKPQMRNSNRVLSRDRDSYGTDETCYTLPYSGTYAFTVAIAAVLRAGIYKVDITVDGRLPAPSARKTRFDVNEFHLPGKQGERVCLRPKLDKVAISEQRMQKFLITGFLIHLA